MNYLQLLGTREDRLLGICATVVVVVLVLSRIIIRAISIRLGLIPPVRARTPWRFSIFAIMTLILLVACALAWLRDLPEVAIFAATILLLLWIPTARFLEFRRALADRRYREFQAIVAERKERMRQSGPADNH